MGLQQAWIEVLQFVAVVELCALELVDGQGREAVEGLAVLRHNDALTVGNNGPVAKTLP